MPELDGIEVCRLVKSDPETRDIPVIIVTTKGDSERISAAFAAGCNDYVTKPINKLELVTKIKNHIA